MTIYKLINNKTMIMKKILFSLLLAVIAVSMGVVLTSCSSDDDTEKRYSESKRLLDINNYVGYEFGIEDYQEGDLLVSENTFVAYAEHGVIKLIRAGEATVLHNKITYRIKSEPKRKYNEPLLKFGASKADVIEYEKRKLKSADDDELIYEGDGEYITGVDYIFDMNNKLCNVYLIFNHFEGLWDLFWKERLVERYAEVTKTDDSIIYINNLPNKADMMITYIPNMKGYYNNGAIIFSKYNN